MSGDIKQKAKLNNAALSWGVVFVATLAFIAVSLETDTAFGRFLVDLVDWNLQFVETLVSLLLNDSTGAEVFRRLAVFGIDRVLTFLELMLVTRLVVVWAIARLLY